MTAEEVQGLLQDFVGVAAGPREWGDNRKSWLARGAARLGITYQRARAFWYGRVGNVPAHEWETLKRRARRVAEEQAARHAHVAEIRAAIERLRSIE